MTELQGHEDRLEISADSGVFVRSRAEGSHGRSRVGGSAPSLCQRARCYQSHPWDLYWQALTGKTRSRAPTSVLQDANAGPDAVAQRVEKVALAEPVDGLWLDAQGRFYLSAFQDNAVKVLTPDGKTRPWCRTRACAGPTPSHKGLMARFI